MVGGQSGPGLGEGSVKAVKMISMRRQDKSMVGIAIIVHISIASTLKTTAYMKLTVVVVEQPKNREQRLPLTKGGKGNNPTYQRYTERAVNKLIKILSVKKTNLAEDLAELSKKMKLLRTPDVSLVDVDSLTAQVFMAKPRSCKKKRTQK